MSRRVSRDRSVTIADGDGLAVIREEQASPMVSKIESIPGITSGNILKESVSLDTAKCDPGPGIEEMLANKEAELRAEFDKELKTQLNVMKEKFDYVLQHEQMRSCYMLREAHRERKEKVQALQTQLECQNMTGLMYVLCSERRKSKLEKLRIIEEYTEYIHTLQDILTEGQLLILHLSRGYKTAGRVDHEWREKMRSIIKEFQEYVYHFAGGTPESNQYVFDVPALLKTEAAIVDDPDEDPCYCDESVDGEGEGEGLQVIEQDGDEVIREKSWWELLEGPCRPFVMFGDMADYLPPKRRRVVAVAKAAAAKTAPAKWKEYVFNEMFVKANCPAADVIKDEYPKHLPLDGKWECQGNQTEDSDSNFSMGGRWGRRATANSNDMRNMGSILKIITSGPVLPSKTNLLGARDSMELASATRLREKRSGVCKNVSINVTKKRTSSQQNIPTMFTPGKLSAAEAVQRKEDKLGTSTDSEVAVQDGLGSYHQDSLQVVNTHKPDVDHKINYEKICPMEECQRMQVDSFMRTLPGYMRASPYTLFEQTFDGYETCSPEQLLILKQRLGRKSKGQLIVEEEEAIPEYENAVDGVGVQTSDALFTGLPPCTCRDPNPSMASSTIRVFKVEDLFPMKEALDEITKECFHNQHILFDRFKVVGQETTRQSYGDEKKDLKEDFKNLRVQEIKNILRKHPSMLDLFQQNTRC